MNEIFFHSMLYLCSIFFNHCLNPSLSTVWNDLMFSGSAIHHHSVVFVDTCEVPTLRCICKNVIRQLYCQYCSMTNFYQREKLSQYLVGDMICTLHIVHLCYTPK